MLYTLLDWVTSEVVHADNHSHNCLGPHISFCRIFILSFMTYFYFKILIFNAEHLSCCLPTKEKAQLSSVELFRTWRYHLTYSKTDELLQIKYHMPKMALFPLHLSSSTANKFSSPHLQLFSALFNPFLSYRHTHTWCFWNASIKMNCGALKKDVHDLILPALAVNQTLSLWCV